MTIRERKTREARADDLISALVYDRYGVPDVPKFAHLPRPLPNLSFEEATAMPFGGGTALSFLRRAKLLTGESILISGASDNAGLAAVQLATYMGGAVTGVCSAACGGLVQSLGAAQVIDYMQKDFTALAQGFDAVLDVACSYPVARCLDVLKPRGRLIRLQADLPEPLLAMLVPRRSGRQVIPGSAAENADDLKRLADLVVQGRYRRTIARVFRFKAAIETHRYAVYPSQPGSVVISMDGVSKVSSPAPLPEAVRDDA